MEPNQKLAVLLGDFMTKLDKDLSQIAPINAVVVIFIEEIEDFNEFFILFCFFDSLGHEIAELIEVDFTTVILISVFHHLTDFFFCWVLTKRTHNCAEFLHRDSLVVVDIEHLEDASKVFDLLMGEIATKSVELLLCDSILLFSCILILVICRLRSALLRV